MILGAAESRTHRIERMSDFMRVEAARSLALLKEIDGTIEALIFVRHNMDALSVATDSLRHRINTECFDGKALEVEVAPVLEQMQDGLQKTLEELEKTKLKAESTVSNLKADDDVIGAFEQAINAVLILNAKVEQVRWAVLERGADCEEQHQAKVLRTDADIDDFLDSL